MTTIKIEFTADQIRDLLAITDQATVKAINHANELTAQGKVKAAAKMNSYSDRLMTIMDILEPTVAALDVKAHDDVRVARMVSDSL